MTCICWRSPSAWPKSGRGTPCVRSSSPAARCRSSTGCAAGRSPWGLQRASWFMRDSCRPGRWRRRCRSRRVSKGACAARVRRTCSRRSGAKAAKPEEESAEVRALRVLALVRTVRADGELCREFAGPPEEAPKGCAPWFEVPGPQERRYRDRLRTLGRGRLPARRQDPRSRLRLRLGRSADRGAPGRRRARPGGQRRMTGARDRGRLRSPATRRRPPPSSRPRSPPGSSSAGRSFSPSAARSSPTPASAKRARANRCAATT